MQIWNHFSVVLASNSPRRKELLSLMGVPFTVDVSNADERVEGEPDADVHSQHQNLLLNKEGFQLNVLDILSHNDEPVSYTHLDVYKRQVGYCF